MWSKYDNKFITEVPIPCGKCAACLQRKISEWSFRLETERLEAACTYFVTLTYDNQNVPLNKYGKMTLNKKDFQLYMKQIRHSRNRTPDEEYGIFEKHYYHQDIKKFPLKYYCVGEYGTKKFRPHMHVIMYNVSKHDIERLWTYGSIDIQVPRSSAAMSYTIKYLSKRIYKTTPGNVSPEFSLMSKGIGLSFATKMSSWYKKNLDTLYTVNESGIKSPISKYLRNAMLSESERDEQIPIIKKSVQDTEDKERKKLGDKYENRQHHKKAAFHKRFKSQAKPRKDT